MVCAGYASSVVLVSHNPQMDGVPICTINFITGALESLLHLSIHARD